MDKNIAAYQATMKENAEITRTLSKGYQKSMKESFRKVLISSLGEDEQAKILAITSTSHKKETKE